jgi:hypothetical protein
MTSKDRMTETTQLYMEDGFLLFLLDVKKKVKEWGSAYITEMATSTWRNRKRGWCMSYRPET